MGTRSYWQATVPDRLQPGHRPPPASFDCDVLVVGAGYVGAYLALRLCERGLRVAVVDAVAPAHGASSRSAGMALTGLAGSYADAVETLGRDHARAAWQLTVRNRHLLLDLVDRLHIPLVERCGSLVLAESEREARALRDSVPLLAEDGLHTVYHAFDPLGRGFLAGLEFPDDLGIHPAIVTLSILAAAQAEVYAPARVLGWQREAAAWRVSGDRWNALAHSVFLATNAYTGQVLPDLASAVQPVRGQVLVTAPLDRRICSVLAYADDGYQYFRQLPDGRLLLGGCRKSFAATEVGLEDEAAEEVHACLDAYLARVLPEADGADVDFRWSGPMGFTPDGLPLAGFLDEGLFLAAGFTGHGFSVGLATADALLEHVFEDAPLGLLDLRRIGQSAVTSA